MGAQLGDDQSIWEIVIWDVRMNDKEQRLMNEILGKKLWFLREIKSCLVAGWRINEEPPAEETEFKLMLLFWMKLKWGVTGRNAVEIFLEWQWYANKWK